MQQFKPLLVLTCREIDFSDEFAATEDWIRDFKPED